MKIGEAFKRIRLDLGLKQIEMAKQLGWDHSYLSAIELSKKNVLPEHIFRLAAVAGKPICFLPNGEVEIGNNPDLSDSADDIAEAIVRRLEKKGMMGGDVYHRGFRSMCLRAFLLEKLRKLEFDTDSLDGLLFAARRLAETGKMKDEHQEMLVEVLRGDRSELPDFLLMRLQDAFSLLFDSEEVTYYDLLEAQQQQQSNTPNHNGQGCRTH